MARPAKYSSQEKICPVCDKTWIARTSIEVKQTFLCSTSCRVIWNANKRRMDKRERPCKRCGASVHYLPCQQKTKWFCSRSCSISYNNSGSKNSQWKGGTCANGRYWKRKSRERDNFTCQYPGCGKYHRGKGIHAHHKIPASIEGAHSLENMITLCNRHHRLVENRLFKAMVEAHPDSARAILTTIFQDVSVSSTASV